MGVEMPRHVRLRVLSVVAALLATSLSGALAATPASADGSYLEQQGHHGADTFTNYHNASGVGPKIAAMSTVVVSCKVYDPYIASANPDGYWYRIASSPWNNNYYAVANTFFNGDPINGPYSHNTDFNVPDCSAAPAAPPSVSLSQGPAAPAGYRYAVTLSNFAANAAVSVNCRDSVSPAGFYTFSMTTNGEGGASTQAQCYSGDGPDHWVVAGGVESNHVQWGAGSGGATPPLPSDTTPPTTVGSPGVCPPPTGGVPVGSFKFDVMPKQKRTNSHAARDVKLAAEATAGVLYKAGPVTRSLLKHYLGASGADYTINVNRLLSDQKPLLKKFDYYLKYNTASRLSQLLNTVPSNSCGTASISTGWIGYTVTDSGDWYYAMRRFSYQLVGSVWLGQVSTSGSRPMRVTFRVMTADTWNFNPDDPKYGKFELLADDGWAADFRVLGGIGPFAVASDNARAFNSAGLGIPLP